MIGPASVSIHIVAITISNDLRLADNPAADRPATDRGLWLTSRRFATLNSPWEQLNDMI